MQKGKEDCYLVKEFEAPVCRDGEKNCTITDIIATGGECTSDSTYHLTLDFHHEHAGNQLFDVFTRDNKLVGTYPISQLPVTIKNFKKSGKEYDYLRVCINDTPDCCKQVEFRSPLCN